MNQLSYFIFQDVFPSCFTDCTGEEQAGNFSFRCFTGVKQQDFPRRSFHSAQMKIKQVTVTKFISALLLQGKLHYFKTSNSSAVGRFYRTLIGKPVTLNTFYINRMCKFVVSQYLLKVFFEEISCQKTSRNMCQVFKICNLCNTCLKILNFPAKRLSLYCQ